MKIQGRVVDRDGQPAGGVEVRITPGDEALTTGSDGMFAFERNVDDSCHVIAQKDDWYAGPLLVWPTDTDDPIELVLQLGATLCVRVAGTDGVIAGAVIRFGGESIQLSRTTSNTEGVAHVRGVPPGSYHGWVVPPAGWAQERVHATVPPEPGVVVEAYAKLVPGSRLSGVVLRGKKPSRRAALQIRHAVEPSVFYVTRADDSGAWAVEARAGRYHIRAADDEITSDEVIVEHDGRTPLSGVKLQLNRGVLASLARKAVGPRPTGTSTIRGVVLDDQRNPVIGVRVGTVIRKRGSMTFGSQDTTDARGRFELENLPPGEYTVRVEDRERIPTASVTTRAHAGDRIELLLPAAGTITGRVMCDGMPATTVQLDLADSSTTPMGRTPQRPLIDGRFTLRNLECRAWRLFVQAPGTRRTFIDVDVENGTTLDLGEIKLERGQHISGTVRDSNGTPIAGARVRIGRAIHELLRDSSQHLGTYQTTTDATGKYTHSGVDAHVESWRGPYIWATHPRGMASRILPLPRGDVTIDLTLLDTGRIEGRLVGGLPRRLVLAVHPDEPESTRMTSTDDSGAFAFDEVPAGEYTISVSDYASATPIVVAAGKTTNTEIHVVNTLVRLTINYRSERPNDERPTVPQIQRANGEPVHRMMSSMNMGGTTLNVSVDVEPGSYRFSADGISWTPIEVAPNPTQQTIDIPTRSATPKS